MNTSTNSFTDSTVQHSSEIEFSTLIASSVHDIKNSISMLLNSLDEMMQDSTPRSDSERLKLTVLRGESSRINNSLISLLGLYRINEEKIRLNMDEVYIRDYLDEQASSHEVLFLAKKIAVHVDCDDDMVGFFDENLISGLIGNVLVNAAKYTCQKIQLRAFRKVENNLPWLVIEITDDGNGYPQSIIDMASPKVRIIDFSSGSTSLGLYFAREVAALHQQGGHQGHIKLANLPEGGSCFQLWLP